MDKYQKFGIFAILFSLFFGIAMAKGSERILYLAGIVYGLFFIFHAPIEKAIIPKIKRPLLSYGIAVVLNGLFVEVLAFLSNLDKIRAGETAYLFATSSIFADLLMSLPYYIVLAAVFAWSIRHYEISVFELGFIIWIFWAIFVDNWAHFKELVFQGQIVGFILAGFLMLFTLHGSILLFENKFKEIYPNRSMSWKKYPVVFSLQALSIIITFIIAFARYKFF